ncbi:TPA: hypothetical protein ACTDS2_001970 [Salmonella enterica subsp. enterica serovar Infantis]
MTNEEKVLFLFAQTCSVISSHSYPPVAFSPDDTTSGKLAALRADKRRASGSVEADFDHVYTVLEKKLAEKLSN